jgi:hypothetical protein
MLPAGEIAEEANAPRKARGYADVGTAVWKVESKSDEREASTQGKAAT